MKKGNLSLMLFSCAILSTAYISTELDRVAKSEKQITRTIASVETEEVVEGNQTQEEVVEVTAKPFYQAWMDKAKEFKKDASQFIDDMNNSAKETASTVKDVVTGKKSVLVTSNISLTNLVDSQVVPSDIVEKYEELQQTYNDLEKEKEGLASQIKEKEVIVSALQSDYDKLAEETSKEINSMGDEIDALESDKNTLLDQKEELAKALEKQSSELEELKLALAQFDDVKGTMDALNQRIADLEAENTLLKEENEALASKNTELEDENGRLSCLLKEQENLESEVETLVKENKEALEKIASFEKKLEEQDNAEEEKTESVAKSKKTESPKKDEMLNELVSFYAMMMEQQQQQMMMNDLRNQMISRQRTFQPQFHQEPLTFSGNYSNFLGRDAGLRYEIDRMRTMDRYRSQSPWGNVFESAYTSPSVSEPFYEYNTRKGSFSNTYIDNTPILFTPENSYRVDQFDPARAFDFRLDTLEYRQPAMPQFAPAGQMEPSSISLT